MHMSREDEREFRAREQAELDAQYAAEVAARAEWAANQDTGPRISSRIEDEREQFFEAHRERNR